MLRARLGALAAAGPCPCGSEGTPPAAFVVGLTATRARCVAATLASAPSAREHHRGGERARPGRAALHTTVNSGWVSWIWPTRATPPRARPAYQAKKPRNIETAATYARPRHGGGVCVGPAWSRPCLPLPESRAGSDNTSAQLIVRAPPSSRDERATLGVAERTAGGAEQEERVGRGQRAGRLVQDEREHDGRGRRPAASQNAGPGRSPARATAARRWRRGGPRSPRRRARRPLVTRARLVNRGKPTITPPATIASAPPWARGRPRGADRGEVRRGEQPGDRGAAEARRARGRSPSSASLVGGEREREREDAERSRAAARRCAAAGAGWRYRRSQPSSVTASDSCLTVTQRTRSWTSWRRRPPPGGPAIGCRPCAS